MMMLGTDTSLWRKSSRSFTAEDNIMSALVYSPAKILFKSVISIFCCSVSVGNISKHSFSH